MQQWILQATGWLLGLDGIQSIESLRVTLAAPWATDGSGPFWVLLGGSLLVAGAIGFYVRLQHQGSLTARCALGISRGLLLLLLMLTLAEPVLDIHGTQVHLPLVYVMVDGTDSMAIRDQYSASQREALATATGLPLESSTEPSRVEYLKSLLSDSELNFLAQLQERQQCRLEWFIFDGNSTSQLRRLQVDDQPKDSPSLPDSLTTSGQVTALGNVLRDAGQQFGSSNLAAAVLISDFAHNAGTAPFREGSRDSPAQRLAVPIYTIGLGATEAIDLVADVQIDPKTRKGVATKIGVKLRQTGLLGQAARVEVTAIAEDQRQSPILVGVRDVPLTQNQLLVDFPFTPEQAGRFRLQVDVAPLEGEVVTQNNTAFREANVIDDYVRLMYVAYEPSWEWRFIKEVFHRDETVGMDGFRTYLASSDPRVREANLLFLSTLTPRRSAFFANDVIFLDDMPQAALSERFCAMVKEFVGNLGGGLVVISGPRFGPNQLANTPLAEMLPVVLDPDAGLRDQNEFRLQRTPRAADYQFMRLAESAAENEKAWDNLGTLPWYQPVAQVHERADVLAQHPVDTCRDGVTRQPLIAVRRYGEGEVVYLGFNEMWRLRKRYGEKHYRQFWSPMIDRLGLSHALGSRKRFTVRLDREAYRVDDKVLLTVQAYDENYEPLTGEQAPGGLEAELQMPEPAGESRSLRVPLLREGTFELRIPVYSAGRYSLRIKDPVTGEMTQREIEVTGVSAERRNGIRNQQLQDELARVTGGRSYDLTTVAKLPDDLQLEPIQEPIQRTHALWSTPLWFLAVVLLMLGEWMCRKWVRLT